MKYILIIALLCTFSKPGVAKDFKCSDTVIRSGSLKADVKDVAVLTIEAITKDTCEMMLKEERSILLKSCRRIIDDSFWKHRCKKFYNKVIDEVVYRGTINVFKF